MGLREVLQAEIWSKETSRKILSRIWKIFVGLKYVGIGLGVIVLGFALWFWIWTHWLTTKERSTGKIALAQVDALQNYDGMSDAEFDVRSRQANERVKEAMAAALTARDTEAADFIYLYLEQLERRRLSTKIRARMDSRPGHTRSEHEKEMDLKLDKSELDLLRSTQGLAHELLDK